MFIFFLQFITVFIFSSTVPSLTAQSSQILSPIKSFTIDEELSIGTVVIQDLFTEFRDKLSSLLTSGAGRSQVFIVSESSLFRVENEKLVVASRIDREALCPTSVSLSRPAVAPSISSSSSSSSSSTSSDCFVEVSLTATRGSSLEYFRVRFNVADKNDQAPEFSAPGCSASTALYGSGGPYVVSIDEHSKLNTEVTLPTAHDDDTPALSVRNYTLTWTPADPRPPFELKFSVKPGGFSSASLVVRGELDREQRSSYDGVLTAYDGGRPAARSGACALRVELRDVNDHAPQFEQANYSVTVPADTPAQSKLLELHATDEDLNDNAIVSFSLVQDQRELPQGLASQVTQPLALLARLFRVEPDGSLWLVSPLGSQSGEPASAAAGVRPQMDRVLRVPVKAEDNGKPALYNITLVTIIVTPTASSTDSLLSASAVRIISNRGSTSSTSDRVAGGAGAGPLGGGALLQVEEGAEPGTIVGFVLGTGDAFTCSSASDLLALEYLPHAQRYSIKTTARQFDREREAIHELEIVCNERQSQSQSQANSILGARAVRKTVTVEVLDTNDERPTFDANPIELFVAENAPVGTRVGQLRATDRDLDPAHKRMEFALQPLPNMSAATGAGAGVGGAGVGAYLDLSRFRLDKHTGEIYTNEVFDRESRENYSFRVMVSDPTRPELNSTATLVVRVEDRNDHAPLLLEPTCKCFVVKRTASRGLLVGRLRAEDADSGPNANVAFIARSHSDYFKVMENGEVFVMWNGQLPSPLEQPSFSLEVELRNPEADQNREELFTRETIRIEIEDEQLSQPAFELTHSQRSDRLNMSCAEMRFVDDRRLFVARVIARPPPSARGLDKLTYRLIRGNELFELDPMNGELYLRTPCASAVGIYQLEVEVRAESSTGSGSSLSSSGSGSRSSYSSSSPMLQRYSKTLALQITPGDVHPGYGYVPQLVPNQSRSRGGGGDVGDEPDEHRVLKLVVIAVCGLIMLVTGALVIYIMLRLRPIPRQRHQRSKGATLNNDHQTRTHTRTSSLVGRDSVLDVDVQLPPSASLLALSTAMSISKGGLGGVSGELDSNHNQLQLVGTARTGIASPAPISIPSFGGSSKWQRTPSRNGDRSGVRSVERESEAFMAIHEERDEETGNGMEPKKSSDRRRRARASSNATSRRAGEDTPNPTACSQSELEESHQLQTQLPETPSTPPDGPCDCEYCRQQQQQQMESSRRSRSRSRTRALQVASSGTNSSMLPNSRHYQSVEGAGGYTEYATGQQQQTQPQLQMPLPLRVPALPPGFGAIGTMPGVGMGMNLSAIPMLPRPQPLLPFPGGLVYPQFTLQSPGLPPPTTAATLAATPQIQRQPLRGTLPVQIPNPMQLSYNPAATNTLASTTLRLGGNGGGEAGGAPGNGNAAPVGSAAGPRVDCGGECEETGEELAHMGLDDGGAGEPKKEQQFRIKSPFYNVSYV